METVERADLPRVGRRALLKGAGAAMLLAACPPPTRAADDDHGRSLLAEDLLRQPAAFGYGPEGRPESVFGLPLDEAGVTLYPVSRTRRLAAGFAPFDLVNRHGHPLRALAAAAMAEMFAAAERDQIYPVVVSGYRSFDQQVDLFDGAVRRQLARGEEIDLAEAERRAARFVAPPGHSQHQLGTTADLSSWEIGYAVRATFAETAAGRWLSGHAWQYGFILPYTVAAEARTGYVPEPWHLRWVGRSLAAFLWERDYLHSGYPTTDDWLVAIELLVTRWGSPTEN